MEEKSFKLDIVTLDEQVYSGEARELVAPGKNGYLGVLPGHIPLITELGKGILRFKEVSSSKRKSKQGEVKMSPAGAVTPAAAVCSDNISGGSSEISGPSSGYRGKKSNAGEIAYEINGGFMEVTQKKVIVFVDEILNSIGEQESPDGSYK